MVDDGAIGSPKYLYPPKIHFVTPEDHNIDTDVRISHPTSFSNVSSRWVILDFNNRQKFLTQIQRTR
jgi:hypothetical protein